MKRKNICALCTLLIINFAVKQKQFYKNLREQKIRHSVEDVQSIFKGVIIIIKSNNFVIYKMQVFVVKYFPNLLEFLTIVFLRHLKMTDFSILIKTKL